MDPSVYLAFATELLKAYNAAQADKSPEQRRAEAAVWWQVARPVLRLLLPAQIKDALKQGGVEI